MERVFEFALYDNVVWSMSGKPFQIWEDRLYIKCVFANAVTTEIGLLRINNFDPMFFRFIDDFYRVNG